MKLFATFLAHEARIQWRSGRYRLLAAIYVVLNCATMLVPLAIVKRGTVFVGPSSYALFLNGAQPLLTFLLCVPLAVDALAREQQEGSFSVVSLAPVSSAGYALRRWLSVVAMLLPVTLIPTVVCAAFAYWMTHQFAEAFVWNWLLRVVPVLILYSAYAFALGTITQRTILATIVGVLILTMGVGIVNDVIARWHHALAMPVFGIWPDRAATEATTWLFRGWGLPRLPTEAPFDPALAWWQLRAAAALLAGITAIVLGIAPFMLRRARRDIRPWRIPADHQLRSFLRAFNRVREDYTPDAGIEWSELATVITGVVILAAVLIDWRSREAKYTRIAARRYAAEVSMRPEPMPGAIVPRAVHITGRIGEDGDVRTHVTMELRNAGTTPVAHLAFALDAPLAVTLRGGGSLARAWDRVAVTPEPPIAPGEVRTIAFDVAGTPGIVRLRLRGGITFIKQFERHRDARDASELSDLASSYFQPAIDPSRAQLASSQLAPTPRFTPWKLVNVDAETYAEGSHVVGEQIDLPVAIDVALDLPRDMFLADSCGGTSAGGRFTSRCTRGLSSYTIAGGRLLAAPLGGSSMLALVPRHAPLAAVHGPALARAIDLVDRVWPNLGRSRTVFVERAAREGEYETFDYLPSLLRSLGSSGDLVLLPERLLMQRKSLQPNLIAAALLATRLASRRSVDPTQQGFFRAFWSTIALMRLGTRTTPATVGAFNGGTPDDTPLLAAYDGSARVRAVIADLEHRVGADRLDAAIDDFSANRAANGNARELVDAIARRADMSLDSFYRDYFEGHAVPKLTFEHVEFVKNGDRWDVRGTLYNAGTGEALCPVVLRTAFDSVKTTLRVGTGERVPFTLVTRSRPFVLQLDPERVSYRYAAVGTVDNVVYRGER